MSIRSDAKPELSAAMQQTLTIDPAVMQSAVSAAGPGPIMQPAEAQNMISAAVNNDVCLHEANSFNTSNPEHPLKRTIAVTIRASLNDLCLRKNRATWSPPSSDATKAIFQQKKCTCLQFFPHTHTNTNIQATSCSACSKRIVFSSLMPLRRPTMPLVPLILNACRPNCAHCYVTAFVRSRGSHGSQWH